MISISYSSKFLEGNKKQSSFCLLITDNINPSLYNSLDFGELENRIRIIIATKYETLLKLLKSIQFLHQDYFPEVLIIDNLNFFSSLDKMKNVSNFKENLTKLNIILTNLSSILNLGRIYNKKFK